MTSPDRDEARRLMKDALHLLKDPKTKAEGRELLSAAGKMISIDRNQIAAEQLTVNYAISTGRKPVLKHLERYCQPRDPKQLLAN